MPQTETRLLESAFKEFSKASDAIVNYYSVLEAQIRLLTREVEEKNRELETAKEYFSTILNSLPIGVVVTDTASVVFHNEDAERLGTAAFLPELIKDERKGGEFKNGKGHYRWKKESLAKTFHGKEVFVFEDVTEVEKMKERLERDERLRAMGEMAARIAHEIKNPLGSMELFLSILLDEQLRPGAREYIDHIRFGVKTIDRIINNILSYTRPKALVLRERVLKDVVQETLEFMNLSISSRNIEVAFSNGGDTRALFDPDLMKLVIMNLLSNAVEAVEKDGMIRVEVKGDPAYALLVIADSGPGMCEETRKNIFNPFFTTKDKGVGLGLFIVHNIVQAHNGFIEVESREGAGASFIIHIPKASL
jgi:signal transduction histidine kinase